MAGKFKAEWDTPTDPNVWSVTLTLPDDATTDPTAAATLTAIDVVLPDGSVTVGTRVEKTTGVPADTKQWEFTISVNLGVTIAVQLSGYQRVVFPAACERC